MNGFKNIFRKSARAGVLLSLALGLSACSGGLGDTGIQFEGKLFKAIGLGGSSKKDEAKLTDRAPLIVPPDTKKLPVPGSRQQEIAAQAWPDDPDQRKIRLAKQAAKKRKVACAGGDPKKDQGLDTIEKMVDPQRDCKSLLSISINSQINKPQEGPGTE